MPVCARDERREAVRIAVRNGDPFLNGIDFVEVSPSDQTTVTVTFIHNIPGAATKPVPASPLLQKENFQITGGVRITGIQVASATKSADNQITLKMNAAGDFSPYTLLLVTAPDNPAPPVAFDPQLACIQFSFKINCPSPYDCKPTGECPPEPGDLADINYLAKDYGSFRRVMLDRIALLAPDWQERNPADVGIALVELLAYAGDYLSYQQDAVGTEAYLGTARRRTSIRRHARLVDYRMHDGNNARAWLQIRVKNDLAAPGAGGKLQFLTRLENQPTCIPPDWRGLAHALVNDALVFENIGPVPNLFAAHDRIPFYTWSATDYCLAKGATSATLAGNFPKLQAGDVLVFVESRGPDTGEPGDADPSKRVVVRLIEVRAGLTDPLTSLPLTEIRWHAGDALPFAFCLAWHTDADHGAQAIQNVSIALGNIVLVDHGRTIGAPVESSALENVGVVADGAFPRFRPRLAQAGLTFAVRAPQAGESAASAMAVSPSEAQPAVLQLTGTIDGISSNWNYSSDMLTSVLDPNQQAFTVEMESGDSAFLRFGDDDHGARPGASTSFVAAYRVGNGKTGNVSTGSIAHVIGNFADIDTIANPMGASGGTDPESLEHVRQSAPWAFRTQQRAVTAADYAATARQFSGIQNAAATFRWTGSWYTAFLTVDRFGGVPLDSAFKAGLLRHMEKYRMAGQDLEIEPAKPVPLEIVMHICAGRDYFVADVRSALLQVFNNRMLSDGTLGVFHPDNFTLGSRFYLSPLYAAAQKIDGVESVRIQKFEREDNPGTDGLDQGYLEAARTEQFVLDNDPNFPERGTFVLEVDGGR
jgi:hypothetical protein